MTRAEELQIYTRAIHTMSEILEALGDKPDPDGALTILRERIALEREWVGALMALGEAPRRPPRWLRRVETTAY